MRLRSSSRDSQTPALQLCPNVMRTEKKNQTFSHDTMIEVRTNARVTECHTPPSYRRSGALDSHSSRRIEASYKMRTACAKRFRLSRAEREAELRRVTVA